MLIHELGEEFTDISIDTANWNGEHSMKLHVGSKEE